MKPAANLALPCYLCGHESSDHNLIEGCPYCRCLATPGEATRYETKEALRGPNDPPLKEWQRYDPGQAAEQQMGNQEEYRKVYQDWPGGDPCVVDGCRITQQEHHRLAYGWLQELRELRREVSRLREGT